jgi:hypothetical protein
MAQIYIFFIYMHFLGGVIYFFILFYTFMALLGGGIKIKKGENYSHP